MRWEWLNLFYLPWSRVWFLGATNLRETPEICTSPLFTIVAWACWFHRAEQRKSWSHGVSQVGKDPPGPSSPTWGSFSRRRMWERCCTHEDAGIGARQAGQEWQLQWHISKQPGWFEKLLWKTQGEQPVWKGKRKKGEKSSRNSEVQLKLLFSLAQWWRKIVVRSI